MCLSLKLLITTQSNAVYDFSTTIYCKSFEVEKFCYDRQFLHNAKIISIITLETITLTQQLINACLQLLKLH